MKRQGLGWLMIMVALVLVCQGILPVTNAQAEGDVIINKLTAKYIFDGLGDALNYGTVAREWDQAAHAETSACVDVLDRHTNTVFANTDSTYFHAMNYKLEVKVSAPQSLQGMSFALYRFDGEKYVRCEGTEKTVTDNVKSTDLTWEVKEDLKNTRLYVFQTEGDGYVADGQQNGLGLQVNYGASVSASAQNDNYIGKIVIHQPMGEGDSMGFFNTFKNFPSLTFGPETRAYYKEFNQETQQYEYIEIIPGVTEKDVGSVLVNYYYTADKDYSAADGDDGLTMGYTKMDGLSYVDGQFVRNGNQVVGVRYMEKGGYADKLLDNAEKFSKEVANLGGGEIISLTPNTTGGSTVTGPVTDDGYVVSLYDAEVGADGIFQVKKDMGWDGIPVAENEYVIINLICPSKDGKVLMGTDSSDITYFYKEGQGRGEGVMWGTADSNSSQRVIFNFVYADENGIMQPFEGTIEPTSRHGGTLLAPKANVELLKEVHNGAIIANYVYNGQEIHQRTLAPLGRETWVKMDGGYLTLEKVTIEMGNYGYITEGGPLEGAVFGVYTDQDCTQLVVEITTDENGVATSELLAAGTYYVKEIKAPDGYSLPTDYWGNVNNPVVEVTVTAGQTAKVDGPGYQWGYQTIANGKFINQVSNTQYGDLRVEKIISDNGKPLQGVTFGIYTRTQGYGPGAQATYNLVGTMTTNRNGVAVYYDLPISTDWYGHAQPYYVKEISAPDGYKISNNNYVEVYLTADGMVTVDGNGNAEGNAFANDIIRGNMALKKVDAKTNANLEGAEFTIYSDRNCTVAVGVMTTKRGGDADSRNVIEGKNGLVPGYYYVKETKAPEGYLLPANPTVYTVHVLPDKMVDVVTGNEIARVPEATGIGNSQAINIAGTKVWYDEGFENSRPREIRVNLYKGEDTNPYRSVTVSQQTEWKFSFTDLPRFDENGKEIVYTIREDLAGKAYDYYTYITEEDENGNVTVTIANSIKKTKITGKKVWEDTVQDDPDRPNDITFLLFQKVDDELVPVKNQNGQQMTATGSSWNGYKFEFIDLPSYDAKGNKAEYVVQEAESDKYVLVNVTSKSNTEQGNTSLEFTLVNRLTVPLSGTKVWQDSSNADGNRPENVTLVVFRNGERMQPQPEIEWDKETDTDVWTWKVSGLPKYDENNNLLTYTVKEERVPRDYLSYTSEDGLTIYNFKPGSIRLYKVYLDENNKNQPLNGAEFKLYWDEACQIPTSNTVYTTAHAGPTRDGFIEINNLIPGDYYIREEKAPEGFALPVPNKPIKVTVVAGQVSRVNGEHGVVVNVPDSESTTIAVTKAWAGDEDKTDARPKSVTVQLFQNNAPMDGRTMELTADNNWQGEFTKLPGKDANGNAYTYTVKETAVVPGYLSAVTGSVENGFTITNTYNYTSISVKKEWKGLATLEGLPEVTVQLKVNDVAVDGKTVVLSSANNWEASFDQLLIKDENGNEIAYSVEETTVLPDFNVSYSGDKDNGFVVTNTVAGGQITLKKVDGDNGNALSGAKFGIYSDKECQNLVAEMTTGNDGTATSEVIMAGTYYVKEIQAPQNYQISMKDAVEVTVVKDQTVKAQGDSQNGDFTNLKRALVYIKKVEAEKNEWGQFDANSAKPLAGAEFTIYSDNNCTQVVAVLVTDENGYAEAALVPGRQYWVKETKAPAGYEIVVTGTKDFWANMGNLMQLTWGNWDQNINGAMVNVKTVGGAITLTKADAADSNVKLSGAVFGVYSDNACQNKVAEMPTTDANGVSTLEHIAVGTWYVKEITAPEGYRLNDTVYTVNVQANQTAQVNNGSPVTNEKKVLSVTAQLAAKKTVNGSSNVPSGYYSFELYEVVNGQRKWLETVQNVAGNVTFSEITFTQAGTYTYLMKEVKGSDATTTYDETEYTATVTVTENSDGLVADVTYGENASATVPTFANTKASVAVQVKKVWNHDGNPMTNTWPSSAQAVLFIDGEWPSNGQYIVTLNSSNNWAHVWEDLPKYRLENGQQVEIEYEVYESNVYSDYVVKLEKDETTQENLFSYTITNTYVKKDQKLELKVPAQKIVTGANTDEKFTFKMEARPSDPPAPMPKDADTDEYGNLYVTAETTGSASGTTVYFDTIEITAEKVMYDGYSAPYYVTYGWQVSEVIPDDKNPAVTYDEGWYEIQASFQIDEDGKLIFAQRDVWDDDWENIIGSEPDVTIYHYDADWNMEEIPYNDGNFVLPFTNAIETTSVSVNKKWVGGEPVDADVTNFLTVHRLEDGKLSDALTDENNNVLRPTRSADGNTYTFSDLPAGYAYAVKEEKVPGYEASYAPMNIGEDAGQDVDKDFALDGETITNTLVSGGFRFTKQDADGNALPGAVFGVYAEEGCTTKLHELTSAADGVVSLTGLDGGKTYYIKEITAPSGYVLNKTVYSVTIEAGVDDKLAGDNGVIVNERSEAEATFSFNKWISNYAVDGTEMPVLDFVFTVEPMGAYDDTMLAFGEGYPVDKAFTVTVKGDKAFEEIPTSFDLSILKAGTYEFKITEKTDDVPDGWVFSTDEVIVTIRAAQQADGSLTVEEILYCDQESVLEFYNLYYGTTFFFATKQWTEYNGEEDIELKLYYREDYGEDGYGPWTEYTDDYTVTLDKLGNEPGSEVYWEITIDDLPICMNNKPIRYGVAEIGVDGAYIVTYKATNDDVITEDENGLRVVTHGGTIINERNTTEVSGTKVWADSNNAAGLRPDSITIWLYADNVKTEKSVTLKDGETEWSFTDLPKYDADGKEISYTVQEEAVDGYATTYSGDGFTITNTLLVGEGELSFLKYVRNVASVPYPEESYTFTFALTPDANTPDTYSVAALSYEEENTPVVVNPVTENGRVTGYTLEKTLKASADGSLPQEWSNLQFVFTAPGTYTFTLQEIAPETLPDGWLYDTTPYTVQFEVTEGEGKLNVERKDSSDDPVIKNEWNMTTAGIAKFWKDAGYEDDRFTMEDLPRYITARYSTDDGTTWVECGNLADLRTEKGLSVTVSDLGAGMWFINVQNLPAYIDGQDAIWSFVEKLPEDSPYETAYGDGGGVFDPEAGLTYVDQTNVGIHNIHDVEMTFEGTKTMEGREMTAADIFTFEITQQGTDNKWTVQNDADGKILFPTFTYGLSDVGTYTYTVKEIGTGINGVTLDTTEYTVTLNIFVAADGQLMIERGDGANPEALNFVNKYEAVSEITFVGTKTMDGRSMTKDDVFTFEIREVNASGTVLKTWNAQNDETGKIAYPTIRYEQDDVGTHNYIIHETSDGKNGVHVDDTEYTVTVTVTDDGSGKLTVTASGDDYTKLDFVNIYKAQATIQFGGTKTLNGRDLADSEFSFELTEASGNYTGFTKNDADGSYVFAPIFYTQKDAGKTFTYTVKEENTADPDIIYDDMVYTVTVTVIDNGDGTLTLETSGDDYTKLDFENTVKTYSLTLKKTDKLDSDKGLKDAVYGLYAEDDPDCQGTPVYTITTGEDGTGKAENMEKGTYWLKEITAPEGYDVDPTPVKVTVPAEDGSADTNLKVDVADYPLGKVKVRKAWAGDTEDKRPASITVQLLKNGQPDGDPIQLTAENNWTAVVENLQMYDPTLSEPTPYAYTWTETVPAGYTQTGNVTETDENGVEVTTLTNTYYTASGSIQFAGVKTLTGRALAADEFSFELSGGNLAEAEVVKNAADGSFSFSEIQYTEEDIGKTYAYTVKEIIPETKAEGITYDETVYEIEVTITDNGDGTLKVAATDNANTIAFVNAFETEGSLQLTAKKTLAGAALKDGQFTFTLTGDGVQQEKTNDASGVITFDALTFDQADIGSTYTYVVKETSEAGNGYTVDTTVYEVVVEVGTDDTGKLKITYTVDGEANKTMTFANAYEADGEIQFSGTKTLTGRALAAAEFSFELKNEDGTVIETVKNAADGSFVFTAIQYTLDDVGEYTYIVDEVVGTDSEITYDETIYTLKVTVADNGDGTLKVTGDVDVTALDFVNAYEKYEAEGEIQFKGTKTLTGRALAADEFSFELKNEDGTVIETVKNAADGSFTFTAIQYTLDDVGEYTYTVNEVAGTDSEITYDETIYTIKVTVADNGDGTLKVTGDVDVTALDFVNAYEKYEAEGEIQFSGTKTLTGRALAADEFSFELKNEDGTVIETVKNAADGSFAFTAIQYTLDDVGEYIYTVNEVAGTDSEITYDETIYTLKVTVADNGDGTLNVTANMDETTLNFVNAYEKYEAEGELTLDVEKVMNGRAFQSGDSFTFTVSAVSGVPMPERTMVTIMPAEGTEAKVDFGKIEYTESDIDKTYTYTVKEVAGNQEGITYDDKFHTVTVKITDNGDGTLKVEATYADGDKAILTNIYNAEGELTLDVEKVMKGRSFREGDVFTFTVEAAEGVPMPEMAEVVIEPTSGSNTKVDFGKITYGLADAGKTYAYTVKETAGSIVGVTYDQNAYTVTVQVNDNGRGGLMVTPEYADGSRVTFVNTYAASGEYQLTARKKLTGKDLADKQFTFVLRNEQGKEIETAVNDADGRIAFKAFRFNQNDIGKTYTYYVSERNGAQDGYIYDTTVYTVKLTVADNGDGTLSVEAGGIPADGMVFENIFDNNTGVSFIKKWQGKEGPAITLTLYQNGMKMDPQPEYVKNGNVYSYENLPRFDENDKEIVYSAKEAFMDGYLTIYENKTPYQNVTDQVMNGGTIINRSVTDFSVRKEWQGLGKNEEVPAITLTLYCNGEPMDVPTPTPDADGWYTYKNLPGTVNGAEAVYSVVETEVEGFTTSYSGGGDCAWNGDTIVNRKIPKTGDESMIGLWMAVTAASAGAFLMLMKKRRKLG